MDISASAGGGRQNAGWQTRGCGGTAVLPASIASRASAGNGLVRQRSDAREISGLGGRLRRCRALSAVPVFMLHQPTARGAVRAQPRSIEPMVPSNGLDEMLQDGFEGRPAWVGGPLHVSEGWIKGIRC
ncbi:hypothetical protein CALVIDRAFT_286091 [Calocera viscosa TUFC12733]|uniref:Uncharacterized protein n=1 Tax=Calocera viscosa (strain TUFC12733) TaxID=1330018 RepID=A0A167IV07_CALVF|nr:hypothetical protein CALVIDRAFT_286091 [Calocera viscosa TUFC12733]